MFIAIVAMTFTSCTKELVVETKGGTVLKVKDPDNLYISGDSLMVISSDKGLNWSIYTGDVITNDSSKVYTFTPSITIEYRKVNVLYTD